MNIFLWILQVFIAIHTVIGAHWKTLNSPEAVPSLAAIPSIVWLGSAAIDLLCSVFLVIPLFYKPLAKFAPLAAIVIALEMLAYSVVHILSGATENGPLVYWSIVAVICAFIAYGRIKLKPITNA